MLTAPASQTVAAEADQCSASVAFAATATGAPAPTITYTIGGQPVTSPRRFPVGQTTVTATATNCGGTTSADFTVTVRDEQAPVARAKNISVDLVNGTATARAEDLNAFSSDNCSGALLYSVSPSTFTCANIGSNPVTFTVRDASGNTASKTVTVTVRGSVPAPAIAVSPSPAVSPGGQPNTLYLGYGPQSLTLTASGGASYSWSPSAGLSKTNIANPVFTATTAGTFTYTVTATSASGCTGTASVTLKVVDARCSSSGKKLDKVLVCHNGNTLCISSADVADHLKHGDALGACPTKPQTAGLARSAAPGAGSEASSLEAYPNPFTGSTTFRFRAARAGAAQLRVYNGLGQLVATLYNGPVQGGEVLERALDGARLSTGLYTCRFVTDGQTLTQRVVLQR
jgi:hypothetical protein